MFGVNVFYIHGLMHNNCKVTFSIKLYTELYYMKLCIQVYTMLYTKLYTEQ